MRQDLQEKAVAYLNAHDLSESISTFPTIIMDKATLLSNLERQIEEAQKKANEAQEATNKLNGYEEKEIKIDEKTLLKIINSDNGEQKEKYIHENFKNKNVLMQILDCPKSSNRIKLKPINLKKIRKNGTQKKN